MDFFSIQIRSSNIFTQAISTILGARAKPAKIHTRPSSLSCVLSLITDKRRTEEEPCANLYSPSPLSRSDSQSQCRTDTRGTRNREGENAGLQRLPPKSRYAATSPAPDPSASAPPGRPISRPVAPGCGSSRPRVRGHGVRVAGFLKKIWRWSSNGSRYEPWRLDPGGGRFCPGRGG